MNKVEIAFAELQCKRRKGEVEPLEDLLIRHDLTLDTWESAMSELQAKPEAWTKLHDKAAAQCAP